MLEPAAEAFPRDLVDWSAAIRRVIDSADRAIKNTLTAHWRALSPTLHAAHRIHVRLAPATEHRRHRRSRAARRRRR